MADIYINGQPYADESNIIGDLSVSGNITNASGILTIVPASSYVRIGNAGTTSHSFNTNDDLFVSGRFEVDGATHFDAGLSSWGAIVLGNDIPIYCNSAGTYGAILGRQTDQTKDAPAITTGTNGNYWYYCEFADRASNWAFSTQTTPTFYFCGATFNTTHWRSITHNDTDAKDGIGLGSKVVEHEAPVSLTDDAEFGLPDASIGTGWFMSEDGDFLEISWTAAGVVSELNSNGNTAITDNDTDLCAYDSGTQVMIKNRLGAAKEIMFEYHYNTP